MPYLGTNLATSLALSLGTTLADVRIPNVGTHVAWWRYDLGVDTVAGAVSQWSDQVGNANLTQGTASFRPTYSGSGLAFDGSDDYLATTDSTLAGVASGDGQPWTAMVVLTPGAVSGDGAALAWGHSSGLGLHRLGSDDGLAETRREDDTDAGSTRTDGALAEGTKYVFVVRFSGEFIVGWLNGVDTGWTSAHSTGIMTVDTFSLGAVIEAGMAKVHMPTSVFEASIWDGELSNDDINTVAAGYMGPFHGVSVVEI